MIMSGCEWIVEAHGCDAAALADLDRLQELFARLVEQWTAPARQTNWHQFPNTGGITGVSLLTGIAPGLPHVSRIRIAVLECILLPAASRRRFRSAAQEGIRRRASFRAPGRAALSAMSAPAANCPNCGAPVTVPLVERGADHLRVLPFDPGPHRCRLEESRRGRRPAARCLADPDRNRRRLQNKSFVVIGRIIYEYEQGGWNEWHIVYNDGSSGWLSDAQLEYDLSWSSRRLRTPLPAPIKSEQGQTFQWNGKTTK